MFWDPVQMRDHAKEKHGDMDDYDDDEDEDYSGEEEAKYGTYYCSTCGLSFHRYGTFKKYLEKELKSLNELFYFGIKDRSALAVFPDVS